VAQAKKRERRAREPPKRERGRAAIKKIAPACAPIGKLQLQRPTLPIRAGLSRSISLSPPLFSLSPLSGFSGFCFVYDFRWNGEPSRRAAKPTQNALPQSVAFQLSNWQDVSARVFKSEF